MPKSNSRKDYYQPSPAQPPPSTSRTTLKRSSEVEKASSNTKLQSAFAAFGTSISTLIAAPHDALVSAVGKEAAQFLQAMRDMNDADEIPWLSTPFPKQQEATWPPPLPFIRNPQVRQQAFTHRSYILGENASIPGVENQHYERLEFLGDAYLQSISSNVLYNRFPTQREGALSSMRQELVCNKTLMDYAGVYKLASYLREGKNLQMAQLKTTADCFEAYIGGLIVDYGEEDGPRIVNKWLAELFEPKLLEMEKKYGSVVPIDKMARQTLATICGGQGCKIDYAWTGGGGGNKGGFWITVKLTGWGFKERVLGKGWGLSKSDAQLRAAMNVIADKDFVREMEVVREKILGPKPKIPPAEKKRRRDRDSKEFRSSDWRANDEESRDSKRIELSFEKA